jgi:hypothetical protein
MQRAPRLVDQQLEAVLAEYDSDEVGHLEAAEEDTRMQVPPLAAAAAAT